MNIINITTFNKIGEITLTTNIAIRDCLTEFITEVSPIREGDFSFSKYIFDFIQNLFFYFVELLIHFFCSTRRIELKSGVGGVTASVGLLAILALLALFL